MHVFTCMSDFTGFSESLVLFIMYAHEIVQKFTKWESGAMELVGLSRYEMLKL